MKQSTKSISKKPATASAADGCEVCKKPFKYPLNISVACQENKQSANDASDKRVPYVVRNRQWQKTKVKSKVPKVLGKEKGKFPICDICKTENASHKKMRDELKMKFGADSILGAKWLSLLSPDSATDITAKYNAADKTETVKDFAKLYETQRAALNYSWFDMLHYLAEKVDKKVQQDSAKRVVMAFVNSTKIPFQKGIIDFALFLLANCSEPTAYTILVKVYSVIIPNHLRTLSDSPELQGDIKIILEIMEKRFKLPPPDLALTQTFLSTNYSTLANKMLANNLTWESFQAFLEQCFTDQEFHLKRVLALHIFNSIKLFREKKPVDKLLGGILKKTTTERLIKLLKTSKGTSDGAGDNEVEESEVGDGMTMRDADDFANVDDIELDQSPQQEDDEEAKQEDTINGDSPSKINSQSGLDENQDEPQQVESSGQNLEGSQDQGQALLKQELESKQQELDQLKQQVEDLTKKNLSIEAAFEAKFEIFALNLEKSKADTIQEIQEKHKQAIQKLEDQIRITEQQSNELLEKEKLNYEQKLKQELDDANKQSEQTLQQQIDKIKGDFSEKEKGIQEAMNERIKQLQESGNQSSSDLSSKLDELQQVKQTLEAQLQEKNQRISELEKQNQADVEHLQRLKEQLEKQKQTLQSQVDLLKSQSEEIKVLSSESSITQNQLNDSKNKISQMEQELKSVKSELHNLEKESQQAKDDLLKNSSQQVQDATQKLTQLEEQVKSLKNQYEESLQAVESKNQELIQLKEKHTVEINQITKSLEQQKQEYEEKLKFVNENEKEQKNRIEALNQDLMNAKNLSQAQSEQLNQRQQQIEEVNGQIKFIQQQKDDQIQQYGQIQEQLKNSQEQIAQYEQQLKSNQDQMNVQQAQHKKDAEALSQAAAQQNQAQQQNESYKEQIATLEMQNQALKSDLNQSQANYDKSQQDFKRELAMLSQSDNTKELMDNIQELKRELMEKDQQMSLKNVELQQTEHNLQVANKKLSDQSEELKNLQREIQQTKEQLNQQQSQAIEFTRQIEGLNQAVKNQEIELQRTKDEKYQLDQQLEQNQTSYKELQSEYEVSINQVSSLNQSLASLQQSTNNEGGEITTLKQSISQQAEKQREIEQQLSQSQQDLSEQKEQNQQLIVRIQHEENMLIDLERKLTMQTLENQHLNLKYNDIIKENDWKAQKLQELSTQAQSQGQNEYLLKEIQMFKQQILNANLERNNANKQVQDAQNQIQIYHQQVETLKEALSRYGTQPNSPNRENGDQFMEIQKLKNELQAKQNTENELKRQLSEQYAQLVLSQQNFEQSQNDLYQLESENQVLLNEIKLMKEGKPVVLTMEGQEQNKTIIVHQEPQPLRFLFGVPIINLAKIFLLFFLVTINILIAMFLYGAYSRPGDSNIVWVLSILVNFLIELYLFRYYQAHIADQEFSMISQTSRIEPNQEERTNFDV